MSGTANELNPPNVEASPEPEGTSGASINNPPDVIADDSSAGIQLENTVGIARDEEVPGATLGPGRAAVTPGPVSQSWNEKTLLTCGKTIPAEYCITQF